MVVSFDGQPFTIEDNNAIKEGECFHIIFQDATHL